MYRNWTWTINNPTREDRELLQDFESHVRYMVYQDEIGSNGTPHIQGYSWCKQGWTIADNGSRSIKRYFPRAHLERSKGTPYQNYLYCSKQETRAPGTDVYEVGPRPQDLRSKFARICEEVKEGKSLHDVAVEDPSLYSRHAKGLGLLVGMLTEGRDFWTKTVVLYGRPGTGKSLLAQSFPSPFMVMEYNKSIQFFDGYDPRCDKTVIFDDFYGDITWRAFLQYNDRYPITVHLKGGATKFRPEWCVWTSNAHPIRWYKNVITKGENRLALLRRIDVLIEFMDDGYVRFHKGTINDLPEEARPNLESKTIWNAFDELMVPMPNNAPAPPAPPVLDPEYQWFLDVNRGRPPQ